MTPLTPSTFDGEPTAALQKAMRNSQPLWIPTRLYTDDRGWSVMNQLQGVMSAKGQINFSAMYPSVIKAWHRHERQTDFWLGLTGHLVVGVHREYDDRTWRMVIGEKNPGVLVLPPGLWHGAATLGPDTAGLLYYASRTYNPQEPDEQRRAHDSIPGFHWGTIPR